MNNFVHGVKTLYHTIGLFKNLADFQKDYFSVSNVEDIQKILLIAEKTNNNIEQLDKLNDQKISKQLYYTLTAFPSKVKPILKLENEQEQTSEMLKLYAEVLKDNTLPFLLESHLQNMITRQTLLSMKHNNIATASYLTMAQGISTKQEAQSLFEGAYNQSIQLSKDLLPIKNNTRTGPKIMTDIAILAGLNLGCTSTRVKANIVKEEGKLSEEIMTGLSREIHERFNQYNKHVQQLHPSLSKKINDNKKHQINLLGELTALYWTGEDYINAEIYLKQMLKIDLESTQKEIGMSCDVIKKALPMGFTDWATNKIDIKPSSPKHTN